MSTTLLVKRNATPFVTPQEVAEHCRVTDEGEFGLLAGIAATAIDMVEDYTGLALTENTYRCFASGWPTSAGEAFPWYGRRPAVPRSLLLNRSPLVAVEAVRYIDAWGTQQLLPANSYYVDMVSAKPAIIFKSTLEFPTLESEWRADAVTVDFSAGGGDAVPPRAKQAVLILCSHLYDNQGAVAPVALQTIPLSVNALLLSLRV